MVYRSKLNYLWVLLFLILGSCSTEETNKPDDQPLGVSARSFLSDENYTSLTVEIVYVNGFEPSSATLGTLEDFLNEYLDKPGGINIELHAIPSPQISSYSLSDVRNIESKYRTSFTSGNRLSAFVYLADGKSEDSGTPSGSPEYEVVLGKAYKNTSMVIFDQEIREFAVKNINVSRRAILETTIKHEFGHLFGLVNNGTPAQTDHEFTDPDNPGEKGHCTFESCLMARTLNYEQTDELTFGEFCRLDLLANGGK